MKVSIILNAISRKRNSSIAKFFLRWPKNLKSLFLKRNMRNTASNWRPRGFQGKVWLCVGSGGDGTLNQVVRRAGWFIARYLARSRHHPVGCRKWFCQNVRCTLHLMHLLTTVCFQLSWRPDPCSNFCFAFSRSNGKRKSIMIRLFTTSMRPLKSLPCLCRGGREWMGWLPMKIEVLPKRINFLR